MIVGDCDAAGLDQCFQTFGHGSVKNMVFVPLSYEAVNQESCVLSEINRRFEADTVMYVAGKEAEL